MRALSHIILLAVGASTSAAMAAADTTPAPPPSVQIQSVPLVKKQVSDVVKGLGAVTASDEATTDVSFLHAGQVATLDVQTGERVTKGQRLAELTADPGALQNYSRAAATLTFAQQELDRSKTLLAQHLATNAQVAAAQKAYDDAAAAVATERKIGDDNPTQVVVAPFDGFVVKLMVALGDRIQQNAPLLKLARTDIGARIAVGLATDEAPRVAAGMDASVIPVMSAKPQPIPAKVGGVSGSVNPASRLIDCWLTITNAKDRPAEGTSVSVVITVAQHPGWVVPRSAVLSDDKGSYIFQTDGSKAQRVDIQAGIEMANEIEISGTVDPGKQVVVQGNYELQDGMAVRGPTPPSK